MAKFGLVVPYVEEHSGCIDKCLDSIRRAIYGTPVAVYPIRDKFRKGVPKILNECLNWFQDDYFGYFGADDVMLPNAFDNLKNFNGDWCYGDFLQDGKPYYSGLFNYNRLREENFIPAGSVFVKTEILKEIMWNEKLTFAEDWEMWLQLGKKYEPTYINQFQYNYSIGTSVFNKSFFRRCNNKRKFRL